MAAGPDSSPTGRPDVIDIFSILLTHGLILLVGWRLLTRADLDAEDGADETQARPWLAGQADRPKTGPDA
ncbi:hypothetical protein GRI62_00060 [Erythrobacter arachoides]|uniref:Uncharacterized protein n=1 Tax=Aurantiacibacter arachoides TaxID=1850444 RepID=A0A845A307_9SPHN|nr:hypothetical protein [Aurantiacibacter arachoides]MXO91999.1 hypothetical protein [Aurantiacibacter arachoides]